MPSQATATARYRCGYRASGRLWMIYPNLGIDICEQEEYYEHTARNSPCGVSFWQVP